MGPLRGIRVLEVAGQGPGPFAAMVLADLGAEVIRVERPNALDIKDAVVRSRRIVRLDLKKADGVQVFLRLAASSDALIEVFRPGTMERLGLGPQDCLAANPALIYGRMTGWGQDGPYAQAPGHDINYIALAGVLAHLGRAGSPPTPPLNLLGDYGGGGMLLAVGILAALVETARSGQGQVIDAAMVDGSALLMTFAWTLHHMGQLGGPRGANIIDSGAPFYDVYECADGAYISVGSMEPHFYDELLRVTGLDGDPLMAGQHDRSLWPEQKRRLTETILRRTSREWREAMENAQVCFAPVLDMAEAARHPHNVARGTFVEVGGMTQPAPAPRFSRTALDGPRTPRLGADETRAILTDAGCTTEEIESLIESGTAR
jgi:alpha-methylacyl-CoA racemase